MKKKKNLKLILLPAMVLLMIVAASAFGKWKGLPAGKIINEESGTISVMDNEIGKPTSDDPWQEMEKLIKVYYGDHEAVSYEGKMRLIDDNSDEKKLVEEMNYSFTVFNGMYEYRIGQLECISKKNFLLLIDHENKTIARSAVTNAKKPSLLDMHSLKEMLEKQAGDIIISQNQNEKILTVNNIKDPVIQGYQVFYDPLTYRIHKMVIGMIRLTPLGNPGSGTASLPLFENSSEEKEDQEIDAYSYYLEIIYEKSASKKMTEKEFNPESRFTPAPQGYTMLE